MINFILTLMLVLTACVSSSAADRSVRDRDKDWSILDTLVDMAVRDMSFVLEADRLTVPSGTSVMVSSVINFVSVNEDKAVVQVSPLRGPGVNGVGGITVEGNIYDVRYDTDRWGNLILTMSVRGAAVSCRLTFTISKSGDSARVRVDPNYSSDDITLYGTVVPAMLSTVHQARTL